MLQNKSTISSKLSSLIWLTTGSALVIASISLTLYDFLSYKKLLLQEISSKAELVGQSASAALQFSDETAAHDIISLFEVDDAVSYASFHDRNGNLLTSYEADQSSEGFPDNIDVNSTNQSIELFYVDFSQPIRYDGESVGGLFIRYSLQPFYTKQLRHLIILGIILLLASTVVAVMAPRLKREITLPILRLVETSKNIAARKDYTVRVAQQSSNGNELQLLTATFNEMLGQIEERDKSLADHRDHLEDLVRARTVELSEVNKNLEFAREQAEEASRFKSLILDNLTHEFRTPLNGILGVTALVRGESTIDIEELNEMLDLIDSSGNRLLSLLTSLLNLASLEKSDLIFSNEPLQIEEVLHEILPLYHEIAQAKALAFEINTEASSDSILFNPAAFHMLIEPVLNNAFKFTDAGSVRLMIRTDQDSLEIKITDTGKGITPEFLDHIFQPFSQESNGLTRSHEGAGVGLAIAKRVVDLLGGNILVNSQAGAGTTVHMTMPVAPNSSDQLEYADAMTGH